MSKLSRLLLIALVLMNTAILTAVITSSPSPALAAPAAQEPPPGEEDPEEGGGGFFGLIEKIEELIDILMDVFYPTEEGEGGNEANWDVIIRWFDSKWLTFYIFVLAKLPTLIIWWCEKLIIVITNFIIDRDIWTMIWTPVLEQVRGVVGGGALSAIMFGTGGIMYVALGVAGLALIVPSGGLSNLAKPDRVIIWGTVIFALFTSTGAGVDLMGQFEELRMNTIRSIMMAAPGGDGVQPEQLVTIPMKATTEEANVMDFALPVAFEDRYFPEPVYEQRSVVLKFGMLTIPLPPIDYETDESIALRRIMPWLGLGVNLLTIPGAYIVSQFGISFASLAAGAIMILVFFIAALPLGFFEFGAPILMNIVKQYVYLFAVTLMVGTLTVFLIVITMNAFPEPVNSPEDLLGFVPIAIVVAMMMSKIGTMAIDAIGGTWNTITVATTSVSSMAYVKGDTTQQIKEKSSQATNVLMTVGMAAATGGTSAVVGAGAGAALGMTKSGRRAGTAIRMAADPNSRFFQNMGTAAQGGNSGSELGVMAANLRFNRREKDRAQRSYDTAVTRTAARKDPHWKAIDAGNFLTTDLNTLSRAEDAWRKGDRKLAKSHLEQAFGSPDIADKVLAHYDKRKGERGINDVRRLVETAQVTAANMSKQGKNVFNQQGRYTEEFERMMRGTLLRSHPGFSKAARNEDVARFIGEITGATVRQPQPIWSDEAAQHKLAESTLDPRNQTIRTGDQPALEKLNKLAVKAGWGDGELAAIYQAVRSAITDATMSPDHPSAADKVAEAMQQMPAFAQMPKGDIDNAAYWAVLVAEGAQSQRLGEINVHPPEDSYPAARQVWNSDKYDDAVDVFYRGRRIDPDDELPPPPPSPPDQPRIQWAHRLLVEATGSHEAADQVMSAWRGGVAEDDARQLDVLMRHSGEVPVRFETGGAPAAEYLDAIKESAEGEGVTDGSKELLDKVGESLLWEMKESWVNEAPKLAEQITKGMNIGPASSQLQQMVKRANWSKEDLTTVITEAIMGTAPQDVTGHPVFENMEEKDVAAALAMGRDAVKEAAGKDNAASATMGKQ